MDLNINEPKHCLGLENIGATCYMNATIQCYVIFMIYDFKLMKIQESIKSDKSIGMIHAWKNDKSSKKETKC